MSAGDISNVTRAVQSQAEEIAGDVEDNDIDVNELLASGDAENIVYYKIGSYVLTFLLVTYLFLVCFGRKNIALAITVIKQSTLFMRDAIGVIFIPFFTYCLQLVTMLFFGFFIMMIKTCDSFTASDLGAAAAESGCGASCGDDALDGYNKCVQECVGGAVRHMTTGVVATEDPSAATDAAEAEDLNFYMMWVVLFGFFWTVNLFAGLGTIIVSRAVADKYFEREEDMDEDVKPTDCGHRWPTYTAIKQTVRYHSGSAVFGALLIAIIQLVRAIIEYTDRTTKALQERNAALKYVFCALKWCSFLAEKVVKYLTGNAYILVAITGKAYVDLRTPSARNFVAAYFSGAFLRGECVFVFAGSSRQLTSA